MSPTKKRKLNGQSSSLYLSAFAARKSRHEPKRGLPSSSNQSQHDSLASIQVPPVEDSSIVHGLQSVASLDTRLLSLSEGSTPGENTPVGYDGELDSSSQSRAESPTVLLETPTLTLSTFKPSKDNVSELKDGTLVLRVTPGERLVILGQFELSVRKGQITLLGATLQPSEAKYRVYVPLSHSLPVIRCLVTDVKDAEICIYQCQSGLEQLNSLSPLFGRLWNDGSGPLGHEYKTLLKLEKSSFQMLFSSKDSPKQAYLQPVISAPEWNEALSRLSTQSYRNASRTMICGPKSSGKSTFTRLLSNRLLSTVADKATSSSKAQKLSGVAILDLDPGQPEYSVPGQLSLVYIQEPNLGPPFSHPLPDGNGRIVRAHSIAAITPSMDPSLYIACALDLFAHYQNLLSTTSNCPLVINTPGWILGTGLEILVDLIIKIRPTEVIYMSQEGPWDVVGSLKDAAKSTPVLTLPSQGSEYATKTAAHLRTMQVMSYMHLLPMSKKTLGWNPQPLTSIPPWEIRYSGENAGIMGIMCYGEQPPPDLLLDSISGSLVAIVVVDDKAAIPGLQLEEQDVTNEDENLNGDQPYPMNTADVELRASDIESLQPQHLETPLIVRTPGEDIPYFNPENAISLDPKHSHCIGLALIRGIDITRRRLQIITPMSPSVAEEINEAGKSIVLVSGKFDTPGWAYTEELMQKQLQEKAASNQTGDDVVSDEEEAEDTDSRDAGLVGRSWGESFQNAPWVERQDDSQGRPVGSRVWRVRRDLGKSGD